MLRKALIPIEDDAEEAPWMVMGTPQSNAVAIFYDTLRVELQSRPTGLFVAMMLPILFRPAPDARVEQLAPDILAASVPDRPRASYSIEQEEVPPSFVLEVVSPESRTRDLEVKPKRYERIGVKEYALYAPQTPDGRTILHPSLQGFLRRPDGDEFVPWEPDATGRLYSEVLELWLVDRAGELRAQRPDSSWLPTLREEAERRASAEREVARLRALLEEHAREQG
jgi:hypothetical protein